MKFIEYEDLCTIFLQAKDTSSTWGISDFKKLLDMFGDDWYIDDGAWQCVEKNKNMEALRQKLKTKNEAAENYSKNKKNE